MAELLNLFKNTEIFSTKHIKYFDVHESLLEKFRNKDVTFVEIGVLNGGGLDAWKEYFSKKRIDDINSTFSGLPKMGFFLNKYLYSLEFFESIVAFKIDQKKYFENYTIKNQGKFYDIKDLRHNNKSTLQKLLRFKFIKYLIERFNELKLKKYFK